jgi:uncharacterized membrane protein YpjA
MYSLWQIKNSLLPINFRAMTIWFCKLILFLSRGKGNVQAEILVAENSDSIEKIFVAESGNWVVINSP